MKSKSSNKVVESSNTFPEFSRISILLAVIFLLISLSRFFRLPVLETTFTFANVQIPISFTNQTLSMVLILLSSASGLYWILKTGRNNPGRKIYTHIIQPVISILILASLIISLPTTSSWWTSFLLAGFLIVTIILAEYIAYIQRSDWYEFSIGILYAFSIIIFFILSIFLRDTGVRLIFLAPALALIGGFVNLRAWILDSGNLYLVEALLTSTAIGQFSVALHYLPVPPLAFGVILSYLLFYLYSVISVLRQRPVDKKKIFLHSISFIVICSIGWIIQ